MNSDACLHLIIVQYLCVQNEKKKICTRNCEGVGTWKKMSFHLYYLMGLQHSENYRVFAASTERQQRGWSRLDSVMDNMVIWRASLVYNCPSVLQLWKTDSSMGLCSCITSNNCSSLPACLFSSSCPYTCPLSSPYLPSALLPFLPPSLLGQ